MVRSQFRDTRGSSELSMLVCPSREELEQLRRGVAIMTPAEKADARDLAPEKIQAIAADAKIDPGLFAIFLNGYALATKEKRKD